MHAATIRAHLLALVLAVSVPLALILGLNIHWNRQQAIAHAKTSLRTLATTMVNNTGRQVAQARAMLERLAAQPDIKRLDPAHCDPGLQRLQTLSPGLANVVVTDAAGLVLCSALAQPSNRSVNVGASEWFQRFLKAHRFTVGQPHLGPISGKWVSVLSTPIWSDAGDLVGAVHLSLDLASFDPHIPAEFLPSESRYGFFQDDGIMVWRNLDPERVIGTRPNAEAARQIVALRDGEFESLAIDGVTRFFSVVPMPELGWVAFVGVPADTVYTKARQEALRAVLTGLAVVLLLVVLAVRLARRITGPIAALQATARAVHEGDLGVRAPLGGPREVAAVAREFNAMVAMQQRSDEQLRVFLDNSAVIAWLKDDLGRYVFVSDNFTRRMGFARDGVLGKTDHQLAPADIADRLRENDLRLLSQAGPIEVVEAAVNADGGTSWWLSNKFSFTRSDGKRLVGGLAVDITERKHAEQSLQLAATVFESQEGMFVTDARHVIQQVNRAFTQITGYSKEEAVGQSTRLLDSGRHDAAFFAVMRQELREAGSWQGEIWNRRKSGEIYPQWLTITAVRGPDHKLTHYVCTLIDISLRKAAEDEIKHLAFYDALTHLPNRRLLLDRLQQALVSCARTGRKAALLYVDLDNFKTLNDSQGHAKGDLLLQQVSLRLCSCVREDDTVARLGGDEFVLLLENLSEVADEAPAQIEAVGKKMLAVLNQPYDLEGLECHSTPSIGATLIADHQVPVDELLKQADLAMYEAKAAGRNTLRFFDPDMQRVVSQRAALEKDLRDGLRQQQLVLHYQGQVDGSGRFTGVEALVRWRHPQRGLVAPGEFIGLAEATGLIHPLGAWVLETACRQLALWATRPLAAHLTMAVNVSARQFRQSDFVAQVLAVLEQTGANPRRLKLELTESLLVDDVEGVIEKMAALKARGVGFSLDDFGTGYSSLTYLKRLPLDQLKIDQSFVRDVLTDVNDAAIARTIVALGQSLGLAVIAEGVESAAQRDYLARHGCAAYQGYFFGRPLPLAEFELLLDQS
ncbi:MAG: EAL domain-containing protein [Rhodoferax sp.]|nr:EAL domain-containing protein [Rhodoferax sp.]